MKKKIGRPVLPKGQSKDFQIGVRFNSQDAKQIVRAITTSGLKKADWARGALIQAAKS